MTISIFLIDIISYLTDHRQMVGHFIAEDDARNTVGKGLAGQNLGIHGFMVKMLTGDAQGYVEHRYLAGSK
jgi:hypothetical protein